MRREKLEHLVTSWNDRGKRSQGKTARRDVGWTNKKPQSRKSDRRTESDEG